jgi:NAD-dependent isocitrate dehydrogenase
MAHQHAVLIEGDGIGPEISQAVKDIFEAAQVPITWVPADAGLGAIERTGTGCPEETLELIRKHGVALKGPTTTPIAGGHKSVNVTIRKALDLYANVRPSRAYPGIETRFPKTDLIVVRENIEDTYGGIEHMQSAEVAQCLRLITRPGSWKIHKFAFEMARALGRKRITCVHKANIMKITDGLFLSVFREVAAGYPEIEALDLIVDNTCMQLVTRPEQFDVLVLPNLFGDIVSDLCAGLTGGLGVAPGGNIGDNCAVFEAVHGSAPDIAGKGLANPTAMLLSSISMLRHMGLGAYADRIEKGLWATLEAGQKTRDLGGSLGTREFTAAVCANVAKVAPGDAKVSPRVTVPAYPRIDPTVTLRGFDIFVEYRNLLPPLPQKIGRFELVMMSNRGTKVWPGPTPNLLMVDVFRCRYRAEADNVTMEEIRQAIGEIEAAGFHWMHIELLKHIDGKPGFTLAQGQ